MKHGKQRYGVSSYSAIMLSQEVTENLVIDFGLSLAYMEMTNGKYVWKGGLESSTAGLEWQGKEFGLYSREPMDGCLCESDVKFCCKKINLVTVNRL